MSTFTFPINTTNQETLNLIDKAEKYGSTLCRARINTFIDWENVIDRLINGSGYFGKTREQSMRLTVKNNHEAICVECGYNHPVSDMLQIDDEYICEHCTQVNELTPAGYCCICGAEYWKKNVDGTCGSLACDDEVDALVDAAQERAIARCIDSEYARNDDHI